MQIRLPRVLVVAGVMFTALAPPADATPSHPGGIGDTCPEILHGRPTGNLEKTTLPADGSTVRAGQRIAVTLRWNERDFSGPQLHKVLDCVTVEGQVSEALSVQSRDPVNDGTFEHSFVVPVDLEPGSRLCDRGFVSGPGSVGDFDGHKSNDVCFEVAPPVPPPVTAPGPTPPSVTGSSPPAASSIPEGDRPVPPVPDIGTPDIRVPRTVAPDIAAPGPPPETAPSGPPAPPVTTEFRPQHANDDVRQVAVDRPAIPVTGRTEQPFLLLSGAALALGGLAVVSSARRPQPLLSSANR